MCLRSRVCGSGSMGIKQKKKKSLNPLKTCKKDSAPFNYRDGRAQTGKQEERVRRITGKTKGTRAATEIKRGKRKVTKIPMDAEYTRGCVGDGCMYVLCECVLRACVCVCVLVDVGCLYGKGGCCVPYGMWEMLGLVGGMLVDPTTPTAFTSTLASNSQPQPHLVHRVPRSTSSPLPPPLPSHPPLPLLPQPAHLRSTAPHLHSPLLLPLLIPLPFFSPPLCFSSLSHLP